MLATVSDKNFADCGDKTARCSFICVIHVQNLTIVHSGFQKVIDASTLNGPIACNAVS
jgi:hypothetical protein